MSHEAYAAPGDLDTSFGTDGRITTDFFGRSDQARAIAIQADGKVVAAGSAFTSSPSGLQDDFALARYNPDGTLDQSFGTEGRVTTDFFGNADFASAIVIQPDGKIVAAGTAYTACSGSSSYRFGIARYNTDGTLDQSFGTEGRAATVLGDSLNVASAVALQADDRIVVAGFATFRSTPPDFIPADFALARFNPDGTLDETFGTEGRVLTGFGRGATVNAILIQPDGQIIAAGGASGVNPSLPGNFALARYNPDGTLDGTFGTEGRVITTFGGFAVANAIALQSDGRIVAVGQTLVSSIGSNFALARYNPDGTLDQSFGIEGRVISNFTGIGAPAVARGLTIQRDGRLVVAGYVEITTAAGTDFGLARYNQDGTFDERFGTNGRVTTDIGPDDFVNAVAIQPDGQIVVAGSASFSMGADFALARYTADTPAPPPAPECATDVTDQLSIIRSGFLFNPLTRRSVQLVLIQNNTAAPIQGPLSLALDELSSTATLVGADGITSCAAPAGSPYVDVRVGRNSVLDPGETTSVVLRFANPTNGQISYEARVLAGGASR